MVRKIAIYGKNEIGRSKIEIGTTRAIANFHIKNSVVQGSNFQVKCMKNLLIENLQAKMDGSNIVEKSVYKDVIEYLTRINLSGN